MPLRTTRSKSYVKRNDSWVTGVGHDGMTFRARVLSTTLVYPARFRLVEGLHKQRVAYLPKNFKLPSSALPYCSDIYAKTCTDHSSLDNRSTQCQSTCITTVDPVDLDMHVRSSIAVVCAHVIVPV